MDPLQEGWGFGMNGFLKSSVFGGVLSLLLSKVIESQGSTGDLLSIHSVHLFSLSFFWSWPVFFGGTALSWAILLLMS
jgi:hypothetical protein